MDIIIKEIKYHETSEDLLEKYLDFQEKQHASYQHKEVLRSRTYRMKQARVPPDKSLVYKNLIAMDSKSSEIIASSHTGYREVEKNTNPKDIWMHIFVLPQYRKMKIANRLLKRLLKFARSKNKSKIKTGFYPIDTEATEIWLNKLGFSHALTDKVSRLYKDKINWDYIESSERKYGELEDKYEFVPYSRKKWSEMIIKNNDFAERMADFFTEADNLIPWEDIDRNESIVTAKDLKVRAKHFLENVEHNESLNIYAFDGDNVVGMSGTYYTIDEPIRDIGTGLTAVRAAYQRQGLATYMKILVINHYIENFPDFEFLYTENAGSNDGMLHINHSLGFEEVDEWHMYQGELREVEDKFSN